MNATNEKDNYSARQTLSQEIREFYVVQERRATDYEAPKLQKGSSGAEVNNCPNSLPLLKLFTIVRLLKEEERKPAIFFNRFLMRLQKISNPIILCLIYFKLPLKTNKANKTKIHITIETCL